MGRIDLDRRDLGLTGDGTGGHLSLPTRRETARTPAPRANRPEAGIASQRSGVMFAAIASTDPDRRERTGPGPGTARHVGMRHLSAAERLDGPPTHRPGPMHRAGRPGPGQERSTEPYQSASGKSIVLDWALTSAVRPEASWELYFSGMPLFATCAAWRSPPGRASSPSPPPSRPASGSPRRPSHVHGLIADRHLVRPGKRPSPGPASSGCKCRPRRYRRSHRDPRGRSGRRRSSLS